MPALKAFIVEDSPVILENLVATLEELAQVEVVGSVRRGGRGALDEP
jgi:DNA-binding NarL/FixJ family response regulator